MSEQTNDVQRAREIISAYGWNATSYQIINPGFRYWFSSQGDGVVGYVKYRSMFVVGGGPVCSRDRLPQVLREWEEYCCSQHRTVSYFGAAGRLCDLLHHSPLHSTVVVGAQPSWDPRNWSERTQHSASLRGQFHRAMNKGVTVSEWPVKQAENHPSLRACLKEWLETRHLLPLHFLVEPETLSTLSGRRMFVAEQGGRVVGFVTLSPVPARSGWLTEQFPRLPSAPNGTVELLIDAAARAVALDGAKYFTMGLVPLANRVENASVKNPVWLNSTFNVLRNSGGGFYNFEGLKAFKSKFQPDYWEPIYVISREKSFSVRTLYNIAGAFTQQNPVLAVTKSVLRRMK
ncbi:MAG: DUF2156 domain-containing protein [Chthonomonadales bacterium]